MRGIILADPGRHVTISELVRVHACPVRFYYEKNDPVTESERYAICKQLSYHLGHPLEAETIWDEVLTVRPTTDPRSGSSWSSVLLPVTNMSGNRRHRPI